MSNKLKLSIDKDEAGVWRLRLNDLASGALSDPLAEGYSTKQGAQSAVRKLAAAAQAALPAEPEKKPAKKK